MSKPEVQGVSLARTIKWIEKTGSIYLYVRRKR